MRRQYGRHVNFLPPKIKFGAFRLKLAHKIQESPDPHILQWTYRLNCTDTIYAILMTQMGDQVIFISYPLKFDLVQVTINRHQIRTGVLIAPD